MTYPSLSFGNKLFVVAALLRLGASTGCNEDNCYRALFPCESPLALSTASAFCAQVTASASSNAVLSYPTRAVAACGTTTDLYVSACGCGKACTMQTTTTTTTTTAATTTTTTTAQASATVCPLTWPAPYYNVPNGDFECDWHTWTVQILDHAVAYSVVPIGNTGNSSFQMKFVPPSKGGVQSGVGSRLTTAPVTVQSGMQYRLNFWTNFDNGDAGFIGVKVNNVGMWTVDARDHGYGGNTFYPNSRLFTATTSTVEFTFEFLYTLTVASVMRVDTVSLDLVQ